jgi:hypothetical protein
MNLTVGYSRKKQRCPTFSMFRAMQKQAEKSRLFNVRDSGETSRDVPPFDCLGQCRNKQRYPAFSMFGIMEKQAELSRLFNVWGN